MEKNKVLLALSKLDINDLVNILADIYDVLSESKRFQIFNDIYSKELNLNIDTKKIVKEILKFYNDSLKHLYYAPFAINSKNFSHIPDKTELWCSKIADLFIKTTNLVKKNEYEQSVNCFDMLYYLEDNMCDEIVFADELGSWMIPVDQSKIIPIYIEAISKVCELSDFKKRIIQLILRNEYNYDKYKVFNKANKIGTKDQKIIIQDLKPTKKKKKT